MNLLVITGVLSAILTVSIVSGDERIHFPQDEPERTTVNAVPRSTNCETSTIKQQLLVYDSDTDSVGNEDIVIPTKNGTPCTEEANVNSINTGSIRPAVPQARPSRCGPPKQILVYDSDSDTWEEVLERRC